MNESAIKGAITRLNKQLACLAPGEVLRKNNLHADVYHRCAGVSTSKLKVFIDCPAKYKAMFITGEMDRPSGRQFDLGKAAHGLILEPAKFHAEFVVQPSEIKIRRGKAWDEFNDANQDRTIITQDDWVACHRMRDAVETHKFGKRLISGGKPEISFFKKDIETGLIVKCRTDYLLGDLIVDVKTAASAHPEKFGRHAKDLGYPLQDAIYRDVTGFSEFAFLVVEKTAPFVVTAPVLFDEDVRRLGYLQYKKALRDLAHAIDFDLFPGYTSDPVVIGMKSWELPELEYLEGAA
ncbi:PD-(D/E)XK nuclease-like domain-containing protein [Shewanella sp.]|uniref:PD-(D/E)XK nuclease-like domain-containing protein n=1 Tax=Shewanella sp. TaxID=50422 RepID=UPI003F2D37E3